MTVIEKVWELPLSPELVYEAWVSSDTVIPPATRMDVNPVVGGHYRLFIETPEFTGSNEGKFLLVEPPSRVIYTWEWNGDGNVTTIDVVFTPIDHGTRLRLTHSGFTQSESAAAHNTGWDAYVAGFLACLLDNP